MQFFSSASITRPPITKQRASRRFRCEACSRSKSCDLPANRAICFSFDNQPCNVCVGVRAKAGTAPGACTESRHRGRAAPVGWLEAGRCQPATRATSQWAS
jgi:hypothetical protein